MSVGSSDSFDIWEISLIGLNDEELRKERLREAVRLVRENKMSQALALKRAGIGKNQFSV
jgi:hypothetical protein